MTIPPIDEIMSKVGLVHEVAPGRDVYLLKSLKSWDICYILKGEKITQPGENVNDFLRQIRASYDFMVKAYTACSSWFPLIRVVEDIEAQRALEMVLQKLSHDKFVTTSRTQARGFLEHNLTKAGMSQRIWVLMEFVEGLHDWDGLGRKLSGKLEGKSTALQVLEYLRQNPAETENLGRILALDCFFGNQDRVDWASWEIANAGNIFVTFTGNSKLAKYSFTGIDFFDYR